MKKRVSRDLIIFIILIPVFLWAAFGLSSRLGGGLPDYSVINKSRTGLSVFYEVLKELEYPAERSMKTLTEENEETVQIAASGGDLDINDMEVMSWVGRGGTLFYLANEEYPYIDYKITPEVRSGLQLYKYNRGMLVVARADNLTNIKLTKDTDYAYGLLELIHEYSGREIYFNEAHLYLNPGSKSLWDAVSAEFKYIIYQLVIVLAACIYYKGKAFGKAIPLYEEVERSENEYLYSASALYRAAGAWDIMLDNYYRNFLTEINSKDEEWLEYWEREELPSLDKAKEVHEFLNRSGRRPRAKEYIHVVSTLEKLKKIYKKRREAYWKTLKKTL